MGPPKPTLLSPAERRRRKLHSPTTETSSAHSLTIDSQNSLQDDQISETESLSHVSTKKSGNGERTRHDSTGSNYSASPVSPTRMPQVFDNILNVQGLANVYSVLKDVKESSSSISNLHYALLYVHAELISFLHSFLMKINSPPPSLAAISHRSVTILIQCAKETPSKASASRLAMINTSLLNDMTLHILHAIDDLNLLLGKGLVARFIGIVDSIRTTEALVIDPIETSAHRSSDHIKKPSPLTNLSNSSYGPSIVLLNSESKEGMPTSLFQPIPNVRDRNGSGNAAQQNHTVSSSQDISPRGRSHDIVNKSDLGRHHSLVALHAPIAKSDSQENISLPTNLVPGPKSADAPSSQISASLLPPDANADDLQPRSVEYHSRLCSQAAAHVLSLLAGIANPLTPLLIPAEKVTFDLLKDLSNHTQASIFLNAWVGVIGRARETKWNKEVVNALGSLTRRMKSLAICIAEQKKSSQQ